MSLQKKCILFYYLRFPLNEKERLQKWVRAVWRKDYKQSSSSTLCSLHFSETDFFSAVVSEKQMLKKCAVSTVFNFPNHSISKLKQRRVLHQEASKYTYRKKHLYTYIL